MPEAPGIKRAAPPDKPPAGAVHQLNQLNRPELLDEPLALDRQREASLGRMPPSVGHRPDECRGGDQARYRHKRETRAH